MLCFVLFCVCAEAFVLDFNPAASCLPTTPCITGGGCNGVEGTAISQDYGDQPGIDVSYRGISTLSNIVSPYANSLCSAGVVQYWDSGYGSLNNVAYSGEFGSGTPFGTQITFQGSVRGIVCLFCDSM